MMEIDQGSIIRGVRSTKYPGACCYAIVISASCDIANRKIDKVYYLTAVKLDNWMISDVGMESILGSIIKSKKAELVGFIKNNDLDYEAFETLSREDAYKVIDEEFGGKEKKRMLKAYDSFMRIKCGLHSNEKRLNLHRDYKENFIAFMQRLEKGDLEHYYYLPYDCYAQDKTKYGGLVVDLQEIDYIAMDDMDVIMKEGIDYLCLNDASMEQKTMWEKKFYLIFAEGHR